MKISKLFNFKKRYAFIAYKKETNPAENSCLGYRESSNIFVRANLTGEQVIDLYASFLVDDKFSMGERHDIQIVENSVSMVIFVCVGIKEVNAEVEALKRAEPIIKARKDKEQQKVENQRKLDEKLLEKQEIAKLKELRKKYPDE